MKNNNVACLSVFMACLSVASVNASVLTFDDIPGQDPSYWAGPHGAWDDIGRAGEINPTGESFSSAYSGYLFSNNAYWVKVDVTDLYGYSMDAISGGYALMNYNGQALTITTAAHSLFTFDGLWAKAFGVPSNFNPALASGEGTISGFKDGVEVWSMAAAIDPKYRYFEEQMASIDTLILNFYNTPFLADNLALSAVPAAVPLPAAVWLFGSALVGFSAFTARKNKKIS